MEFLRSASKQSSIAHRYVLLLGRHCDQLNSNHNSNSTVGSSGPGGKDVLQPDLPAQVNLENGQAGYEPTNMSFPDPNDFLFGMGVPQDFLTTDWLPDDAWTT
ncbi:transcriptional activator protein acu-15 [Ilyonectria robusta]